MTQARSDATCKLSPRRAPRPPLALRALFGQWGFHRNRGEYKLALALAEQMEKSGEAWNDVTAQWVGRWASGFTRRTITAQPPVALAKPNAIYELRDQNTVTMLLRAQRNF
jgi:hypothetical protein